MAALAPRMLQVTIFTSGLGQGEAAAEKSMGKNPCRGLSKPPIS